MTKLLLRLLLLIVFALGAFAALGIYIFKNNDPAWLCVALLLGRGIKDLC